MLVLWRDAIEKWRIISTRARVMEAFAYYGHVGDVPRKVPDRLSRGDSGSLGTKIIEEIRCLASLISIAFNARIVKPQVNYG
jgi:hypothetical protein